MLTAFRTGPRSTARSTCTRCPEPVRLGLITERTEPRYRKLGILSDTRTAPRSELPLSA